MIVKDMDDSIKLYTEFMGFKMIANTILEQQGQLHY